MVIFSNGYSFDVQMCACLSHTKYFVCFQPYHSSIGRSITHIGCGVIDVNDFAVLNFIPSIKCASSLDSSVLTTRYPKTFCATRSNRNIPHESSSSMNEVVGVFKLHQQTNSSASPSSMQWNLIVCVIICHPPDTTLSTTRLTYLPSTTAYVLTMVCTL